MHPRVESLPRPDPDFRRFLSAVRRQPVDRIPLIELAVHPTVVSVLLDRPDAAAGSDVDVVAAAVDSVALLHRLGYDVVKVSAHIPFGVDRVTTDGASLPGVSARQWQNQHHGPIQSMRDFEAFDWPSPSDEQFAAAEAAARVLPDGMRLIGFAGGVLEFAQDLIGLERFMYAIYDAPELVAAVLEMVGQTIERAFERFCRMEAVCAIWLGDDLGSKNGLLISPDVLEAHVFPWYARYVELAHRNDRPFLLHSCGKTDAVMPTLIDEIGIDAKHSFEDAIEPVEAFMDSWGSKVAALGGIDVNLLALGDEQAIARRVLTLLEHAGGAGGYACGSGNSIPDYVSAGSYMTMIEAVARFNGRI